MSHPKPEEKESASCLICLKNPRKYNCPRCGIPYCSLSCYQDTANHGDCSESFYRDCVLESLKTKPEEKNKESANKIKEILQRVHESEQKESKPEEYDLSDSESEEEREGEEEEESLDSDDDEPLAKRLEGIDLDDSEKVWDKLTQEERENFEKFAKECMTKLE